MKPIVACTYCHRQQFDLVYDNIRDWEYGVEGSYAWCQCRSCGGVQLQPFPDLDDLKRAYNIEYHGYATGEKRGFLFSLLYAAKEGLFRRQMSRFVAADSKVLDVGCGAGEFLLSIKKLGLSNLQGIDFSQDMVAALERQGIDAYCGTFTDFPGQAESYDLISMNNYLEHTVAPRQELEKSLALLRPGAILVGEVPGFDSWERRIFGRFWGGNHVPRHTHQFNASFLLRLLKESGFEDVQLSHQLNTSHWALSVQNFLQRNVANLRDNPAIRHGRSRYYVPLLLLFIPINIVCVLMKKSGCVKFSARKPY
ncbi:MAG: class I SAM-dependent methyltransferase [Gammaproteobacteria bacterium]|nr:class I SAM-dependent methyltransferase [Gammaproteobacteria bacterium]